MRALGWVGIVAGLLIAMLGFMLVTFMHYPSEQSVLRLSSGRWDDWLAVVACFGGGWWLNRRGDKLAGGPIVARFRAMMGLSRFERGQRNIGCLTFGVGIGLVALVLFMTFGVAQDDNALPGMAIMSVWLIPLVLMVRGGWRRFSGRGWLFGERPWF